MTLDTLKIGESLLGHQLVSQLSNKDEDLGKSNYEIFQQDLNSDKLSPYKPGDAVAYQHGNLVGHSSDKNALRMEAEGLYGKSSLDIFTIPERK